MNFSGHIIWIIFYPSSPRESRFPLLPFPTANNKSIFAHFMYNEKQMLCYANDVTHVPEYHNTKASFLSCFFLCFVFANAKSKLNMLNLYA